MRKLLALSGSVVLLWSGVAGAEDGLSCKGSITSKQGEGMVVRSFRFEISGVTGADLNEVLGKCQKIALQKQDKAGRANPGVPFQRFSDLDLQCSKGAEKFPVRRSLKTSP